ncbi:L-type lectin-domain containing protein [Actinoplanes sp. N902-109]|uniref:L-type lectin-domain containing protein n=1 Tax=Actinoplanes sp. (strain N902-109) TaxID=649831 RepID=UPI00032955F1|nr:L-type lectin-domain containing protein [Actinoplanes sp. N902-109]AGL20849.1 legume lectin beta domain-containing protein [Actinoplanes sp. N902-109]
MNRRVRSTWKTIAATAAAVAVAVCGSATAAQAASIKVIDYPNFNSGPALSLQGAASVVKPTGQPKVLRLVKSDNHTAGAAWAAHKISPTKPFITTFVGQIATGAVHGDGIAFVIQGAGNKALGWDGGGMGYSGIKSSVAVEFDTYKNSYDISDNHVAIVTGGNAEVQAASANAPRALAGQPFRGTISYEPLTKTLQVFVNAGNSTLPGTLVLSRTIDIAAAVGSGPVHVGFTAANGSNYSAQDIDSWTMFAG